mmetsp:Transcript_46370/g.153711  ORF Transcript_46370/g.153711 Transcript_46370/m.153711 type:complete len:216 (-) Transcript_46370:154-801(-)
MSSCSARRPTAPTRPSAAARARLAAARRTWRSCRRSAPRLAASARRPWRRTRPQRGAASTTSAPTGPTWAAVTTRPPPCSTRRRRRPRRWRPRPRPPPPLPPASRRRRRRCLPARPLGRWSSHPVAWRPVAWSGRGRCRIPRGRRLRRRATCPRRRRGACRPDPESCTRPSRVWRRTGSCSPGPSFSSRLSPSWAWGGCCVARQTAGESSGSQAE